MGQWVSWLRALPVACSTVEVFVFFISWEKSCFLKILVIYQWLKIHLVIGLQNPLPACQRNCLHWLLWADQTILSYSLSPAKSFKSSWSRKFANYKKPERSNLEVGAKMGVTFDEDLKIEINLISDWISVVLAEASLEFWNQGESSKNNCSLFWVYTNPLSPF